MNETQHIEAYLNQSLLPQDRLLMEAQLLIDERLNNTAVWQQRTYDLIKAHGRKCLREDIEKAQHRVFTEKRFKAFRQIIHNLFN